VLEGAEATVSAEELERERRVLPELAPAADPLARDSFDRRAAERTVEVRRAAALAAESFAAVGATSPISDPSSERAVASSNCRSSMVAEPAVGPRFGDTAALLRSLPVEDIRACDLLAAAATLLEGGSSD